MKALNHNRLFLNDAIGALLTALIHGFLLSRLTELTGIPRVPLITLSFVALTYAIYSATCYFLNSDNWRLLMKIIAFANICFCIATTILMIYYRSEITLIAVVFFVGEIALISVIAAMEFVTAKN